MAKVYYPIFYISKNVFTAVLSSNEALQITPGKYNDGFIFNIFKSRAKVIKLERANFVDRITADQFYSRAFSYMKMHLDGIAKSTEKSMLIASLPVIKMIK